MKAKWNTSWQERERQRERDRESDRETERQRDRETERRRKGKENMLTGAGMRPFCGTQLLMKHGPPSSVGRAQGP